MIKKIIFIIILSSVSSYLSAETVAYKLKGDLKSKGSEAIEVNATPLIDNKEIIKSKEQLITIVKYANNQSNDVVKKMKIENQDLNTKVGQKKFLRNMQVVLFI